MPVLVTVRACVALLPTATSPKLTVDVLALRTPEFDVAGPVLASLV